MLKQIEFNRIYDMGWYAGPHRWTRYEINWNYNQFKDFQKLFWKEQSCSELYAIINLFPIGSTLTIGGLSGKLVAPENLFDLKYPSGSPMEEAWQYLWEPYDIAKQLINVDINVYANNQKRIFEHATAIFKSGVATKLTAYGQETVEVTQIPLCKLPGMLKLDLCWQLSGDF
jgi:hypothetical protein